MLKDLLAGLADGSLAQKLKLYTQVDILLIDEVGFDRLEQESARNTSLFFKVIDARYDKASTWLTTNVDFKDLGSYLGDPVITTAIVDRLVCTTPSSSTWKGRATGCTSPGNSIAP